MFETGARPYLEIEGLIFRFDGINREKKEKNFEGGVMLWIYNPKESNNTEGVKALWRYCLSTV